MSTEINTAEPTLNKLFESLISLLTRPDKQDWFQVANDYVMDVFEMPSIMHFKDTASDDQKTTFCKAVGEAIKCGNKRLLVPEPVKGDVKPDAEEVAKSKSETKPKAKAKAKSKPEPEAEAEQPPQPAAGSLEDMLVNAVMHRIGKVSVPDHVIESKVKSAVKEELDNQWSAVTQMVNKKLEAMQEQVNEFTKTTPPRDIFHVAISAVSEKEIAAAKQVVNTETLTDLP